MKKPLQKLGLVAAVVLLLLAAMLTVPFLLTRQLMRLALGKIFPTNNPSVGSATLSFSGTLVLHDLVLHDTGELAQQPLISIGEFHSTFAWAALLSRRISRVRAEDVTVYLRSNSLSPLSLLDLFFQQFQSDLSAEFTRNTSPLWIDTLNIQGLIHPETIRDLGAAKTDWPLTMQMTMSGDRLDPARQLHVAIGEVRQLPEKTGGKPAGAVTKPIPNVDAAFGLRAEIETQRVAGKTRVVVHSLAAKRVSLTLEADALRRYAPKLPADLHGPIAANLGALNVSGWVGAGTKEALEFRGDIRLQDLSVRSPVGGKPAFALDRLTAAGSVESRLDRWAPAALKVRDGVVQWAALTYGNNAVNNFAASWRIDGQILKTDHCAAEIFAGHISGSPAWDLVTHAVPPCDLQIKSINMHEVLANVSPEHLDAEGKASGILQLRQNTEGELAGSIELAFDEPGVLKIGEIEAVKRMLVGNFGLDLANLAMHDLKQYPFQEGRLSLESLGKNSQLKIKFVRQPRTEADVKPPHKEIINGAEVWVGSLIVPTIDMTIPITGKSLAEILSLMSGMHPLIETVGQE